MRVDDDFFLAGIGRHVPPAISVAHAVAEGWYDEERAKEDGLDGIAVEPELSAPDMAVRAGTQALLRSGHGPEDIALLLHATFYRQGPEFWMPASYVERFTVGAGTPAVEIMQGCSGGITAIELALGHLSWPGRTAALVTAADRYVGDFDRWRTDSGVIFGDGAGAAVVSRRSGFARIRSIVSRSEPGLEEMHRGAEPLAGTTERRGPIDVGTRKRAYLSRFGLEHSLKLFHAQLTATVEQALADAGVTIGDIAIWALPHLGHPLIEREYLVPLSLTLERTTWPWGRTIGHLGAGDQFVALDHYLAAGHLDAGQYALLLGVGIGFSWCAMVLEITARPTWAERA